MLAELELASRWSATSTVDGRDIQGWFIPAGRRPATVRGRSSSRSTAARTRSTAGRRSGSSRSWRRPGSGVFYCNPRGSEGYGQAFNDANHRDWGPGPMRDVLAGVDALVADGLADPDRLGVTGGSYGGYLTNWIVGHDQRFRAAMTCRSRQRHGDALPDRRHQRRRLGADELRCHALGGPGLLPRDLAAHVRRPAIRTPLLIQHAERDLRTTIGQAEALFTVLRSLRRPVRLLRVPRRPTS